MNAVPVLLVKNEALWIADVLRPLLAVFGVVLVNEKRYQFAMRDITVQRTAPLDIEVWLRS